MLLTRLRRWIHTLGEAPDIALPDGWSGKSCATPNCATRKRPWASDYMAVTGPHGETLRCPDCAAELHACAGHTVHH